VILDVFSRYVTGWMVASRESAALAERLIAEVAAKQGIKPDSLTIHADRGTSMTSKPVALLLADLGIVKSHSRPHVSNDNPYSEAGFKTLKYRPDFPDRFGSIEDARAFCQAFFAWYNKAHRHSGIALFTPADVHYGRSDELLVPEPACSPAPTRPTPSVSSRDCRCPPKSLPPSGSTHHQRRCS
jgi:putative transposase